MFNNIFIFEIMWVSKIFDTLPQVCHKFAIKFTK